MDAIVATEIELAVSTLLIVVVKNAAKVFSRYFEVALLAIDLAAQPGCCPGWRWRIHFRRALQCFGRAIQIAFTQQDARQVDGPS